LTGEFAGRYVAFVGSMTVKPKTDKATKIAKIVVHPRMRLVEPWSYDIAVMKTAEPMALDGASVATICLPDASTPELFEKVFVAGWGAVRAKPIETDACSTTQFGPAKFKACQGSKSGK